MASKNPATVTEDCAVLSVMDLLLAVFSCLSRVSFGHHGPLIASGDKIGLRSKIKAQLRSVQAWDCDPWIGLTLDFPLGKGQKANDEAGFGVRYRAPEHGSQDMSKLCDYHQIRIKFPLSFSYEVQQGQSPSTITNEHLSYVKIHFGESRAAIEGFGIPFANQEDHQVESWINGDASIARHYDLQDILQQRTLYVILPSKSNLVKILGTTQDLSAFQYPYSEDLSRGSSRFEKELRDIKGQQFAPLYSHPTDLSHLTAVSQSIVQDTSWLHEAVKRVGHTYTEFGRRDRLKARRSPRIPAYFFRCKVPDTGVEDGLHLVIPYAEALAKTIGSAWNHLIKQRVFRLEVFTSRQLLLDKVKDKMDLHRSVLRGAGFYDWMTKTDSTGKWRPLPTINILDIDDQTYVDAVLETVLLQDRARFTTYLSDRPLGIGIITGPPGAGKTSMGATAALALHAKVGKVLCSGPTNTAVDDFAYRLHKHTWDLTEKLNAGKSVDQSSWYRRKLIVRPYSFDQELNAFYMLLKKPELGKKVLDDWKFTGEPNKDVDWKLQLQQLEDIFQYLQKMLIDRADFLCVTPGGARDYFGDVSYKWDKRFAKGVVVDQAGVMNRPDLYNVWGNTLRPCFLIGDTRSEQPTIQTTSEKEPGSENYYNRFAGDGQLSGLEFLQASGLPVFRLDTQVRMAKGMYDLAAQVFYPQLPLQYHQRDHSITNQQPDVGRELEAYVRMKYPKLRKPLGGILHQPLFIHRQNSTIYRDVDGSQACQEQDSAVLSFVAGLVTHSAIDPAQIVILTPWFANAALIERKRSQKRFELLKNMPEAATIESYRGREADIVVVVMSTTRDTGPDITANEHLLITMLTRHKSGLAIFGDICTSGVIGEDRNGKLFKISKPGQELNALQRIDETLFDEGRVVVFSTKLGK
ncbi:hypothetical protein FPRO04_11722 [Fusarium proliferatum]|nr:hypothetical protein FPRO03_10369 [Fusarium proliferatum]KAG4270160.1 hypothetical protein FPRO04_11722 [Fusarium proliferatum]